MLRRVEERQQEVDFREDFSPAPLNERAGALGRQGQGKRGDRLLCVWPSGRGRGGWGHLLCMVMKMELFKTWFLPSRSTLSSQEDFLQHSY